MNQKTVSAIMLTLLLMGMLTLAFNIQPVKAEGTIYIRADGSIDPPTAPIQRDGDIYTFTDNIYDSIVVERSNIIIDGAGYTLQNPPSGRHNGFYLNSINNVTIKRMTIKDFWYGIFLNSSSNNILSKINVANSFQSIRFTYSSSNIVTENTITTSQEYGIYLFRSPNNIISRNNLTNNERSIGLIRSSNNILRSNTMSGSAYNFGVVGYALEHFIQDVDSSNTIEGRPIYYLVNEANKQIPLDAGYVAVVNSQNVTADDLELKNNKQSVLIAYSQRIAIQDSKITNNEWAGIDQYYSSYINISRNYIANNFQGIYLECSSNNIISENEITANTWRGIYLMESFNNKICRNNLTSNFKQAFVFPIGYFNTWDDGYPSGGNYWSDYAGVDVKSGPNQDLSGSDHIGDTPYIIDANNRDHYPLMYPYGAPPPQTYSLTITPTVGGTTDPAPGTYTYTVNSTVQVTAIPNANYQFDYWELDDVNVGSANPYTVLMDKNHTLKAVFSPIPPPLQVSISPLSASILVGQSVTFMSTVSGGYTSYSYQWYLNGNPVSGAISPSWTFTPTASGIYYVHLKVTDAKENTAQSDAAHIAVATVPVGGYSIPIQVQTKTEPVLPYIALVATLTAIFTKLRPKIKRKR